MTEERATVLQTDGYKAWVQIDDPTGCAECSHSGLCGVSPQTNRLEVFNPAGAGPGDRVVFSFSDRDVFRFTTYLYGLPLFMFLAGGVVGYLMPALTGISVSRDLAAVILGFGSLAASFFAVRALSASLIRRRGMIPRITKII
jgi:positive regulator of sigma E activity